ncbi:MAG TPA: DMT family transporter [Alphaproteobacteria bacterium]|nr:DMT family transporter [Alphaproteobacteria bacterium]
MPPHSRLDATAATLMVVLCTLWALNQVAIKIAIVGIPPVLQAGLRSLGGAVLVWLWSSLHGVKLLERKDPLGAGLFVGVLFATEFLFLYCGLAFTTASRSVLLLYTAPFAVAVGAHLFVPGERLRTVQVVGLVLAFLGVVLVFGDALRLPTRQELIGDAMVFLAAMLWGATTIVIKATRLASTHPNKILFYQIALSGVLLTAVAPLFGAISIDLQPLVLSSVAFQVVIVTFASYLTWFWLVTRYPASRLAAFSFLTPVIGVPAGALLLDEPVSWGLLVALVLVASGIYLVNKAPAPSGPAAAA